MLMSYWELLHCGLVVGAVVLDGNQHGSWCWSWRMMIDDVTTIKKKNKNKEDNNIIIIIIIVVVVVVNHHHLLFTLLVDGRTESSTSWLQHQVGEVGTTSSRQQVEEMEMWALRLLLMMMMMMMMLFVMMMMMMMMMFWSVCCCNIPMLSYSEAELLWSPSSPTMRSLIIIIFLPHSSSSSSHIADLCPPSSGAEDIGFRSLGRISAEWKGEEG